MLTKTFLAAAVIAAATAVSAPAANASPASFNLSIAGPAGTLHLGTPGASQVRYQRVLPPQAIVHRLNRQGYRDVRIVNRQGHTYTVQARTGHRGQSLLRVDARSGQVISSRGHRAGSPRHPGHRVWR